MAIAFGMLDIPHRDRKPRQTGITMVLDKKLSVDQLSSLVDLCADHIDILKLAWGTTAVLNEDVSRKKCEIARSNGILICPGGTLSEIFYLQNKVSRFLDEANRLGFNCIEISNGSILIPEDDKLGMIRMAKAAGFTVLSEVGSKIAQEDSRIKTDQRIEQTLLELEAGAWKVVVEGRESGNLGIYAEDGSVKMDVLDSLIAAVDQENLIFEAPQKSQQVKLIKKLGNAVNLGNISPDDIISLETLRLGLRGDTIRHFHTTSCSVHLELGVRGALNAAERSDVIIIIDTLRASSTIVTALAMGVESVLPVTAAEECIGEITAGERGGHKIEKLDYDNSPIAFHTNIHKGKQLTLTTTNGTECIRAAASNNDEAILIGTLLNATAVADESLKIAKSRNKNISIVIAGRNDQEAIEDVISASEIVFAMKGPPLKGEIQLVSSEDFIIDFINSDSGKNLTSLNKRDDVIFCAQKDLFDVVPIYDGTHITLLDRQRAPSKVRLK